MTGLPELTTTGENRHTEDGGLVVEGLTIVTDGHGTPVVEDISFRVAPAKLRIFSAWREKVCASPRAGCASTVSTSWGSTTRTCKRHAADWSRTCRKILRAV